ETRFGTRKGGGAARQCGELQLGCILVGWQVCGKRLPYALENLLCNSGTLHRQPGVEPRKGIAPKPLEVPTDTRGYCYRYRGFPFRFAATESRHEQSGQFS